MKPSELALELEQLHSASFAWALALCRFRRADAEEVLQAAYLKVLEGRARFAGTSSTKTWLFGVIRRTASEHRRRALLRLEALGRLWRPEPPEDSPEEARRVRAALAALSARQREVLELVFYQELTVEEAAAVMAVSVGTARAHYHRGKEALRRLLREDAHEPG